LYFANKGIDTDELMLYLGEPEAVRIHKPTHEDKEKLKRKKIEKDRKFYQGLLGIAKGSGIKAREVSKQLFFKEIENVH